MSVEDGWEDYRETWADSRNRTEPSAYWVARLREAFYAGAQTAIEMITDSSHEKDAMQDEIDHFKSRPR